jgi:hypothetical protein
MIGMDESTRSQLIEWAQTYNDPKYFQEDPIAFPTAFFKEYKAGRCCMQDVEVAAIFAAHFRLGPQSNDSEGLRKAVR